MHRNCDKDLMKLLHKVKCIFAKAKPIFILKLFFYTFDRLVFKSFSKDNI